MKQRTSSITMTACLLALLAAGMVVYLEGPTAVADEEGRLELGGEIERPFGEKTIKGAPFSAVVTFENTQTLSNGSHVTRKMTGALYRDSEGRTRQELPRDGAPEAVLINDNVGGVLYRLNLFQHTAGKILVGSGPTGRRIEVQTHKQGIEMQTVNREVEERERMGQTRGVAIKNLEKGLEPERKVESLGVQTFEGVQAEVTRLTVTIPAGMEGNDQPFDIVSERWYSPDLQLVVLSKRSDPRTGEMVYRLTNINRAEQDRSLFEAPSGFNVTEEKSEIRRREN